ncbi:TfoX/Sxy family protein [Dactylosporangium vinaceum]|uniref:TfoX/Sxy family protein n=1 Tax=Dactylosporangium vinaceum TaxID=53362 RepID=A0ABV5LZN0_9ACTN|nr:TfoX/Sxy family protein [Dactylosporangium vinaceum]UAB94704.1 TfoX/Sxy family protein [Dactylosporangium vinaceum]
MYDEALAARLQERLGPDVTSKRMFGGLVFLRAGRIVAGVYGSDLLVRVGKADRDAALARPGTRPFTMGQQKTAAFVLAEPARIDEWFPR